MKTPLDRDSSMRELRQVGRPEPDPVFVDALLNRMRAAHHSGMTRGQSRWRWTVPLTTGALAAAILILLLMPPGAVTFAQVQSRLREARTVRFDARLVVDGPGVPEDLFVIRAWFDQDLGVRSRAELLGMPVAGSIVRADGRAWLTNHLSRTWAETDTGGGVQRWLRSLDPTRLLLELRDNTGITATPAPEAATPGILAFTLSGESLDLPEAASLVLRVDEQSRLPVGLTYALPPMPQGHVQVVIERFDWGAPIEVDFEPPAADEGWRQAASVDALFPDISEETLLGSLRDFAQRSGGYYPGHARAKPALIALLLRASRSSTDDLLQRLIAGGLYIIEQARQGADPVYRGGRVTAAQPDAALITWRTPGGGLHRITGSLDARTASHSPSSVQPD